LPGFGAVAGWTAVARMFLKPPADPGRGQPSRLSRAFPGQAQVVSERPGEAELGVGGDDQPGPPVRGGRVADLGDGPPEDLLEQPEGVLKEQAVLHT
jgi:hypothetical protein